MDDAEQSPFAQRPPIWLVRFCGFVLGVVALIYIGLGVANLAFRGDPFDLRRRWIDQQYIFHRQNPFDVLFRANAIKHGTPPPLISRNAEADLAIGPPDTEGYPPWSFFSGAVLVGLPWEAERVYFAALNLVAIGFIGWWGFSVGRKFGLEAGVLFAAATAAMGSVRVTLSFGQYGILVDALLVGALVLEERRWSMLGGLLLGIAMLKPNIAAPFMLCFLVQRRFRALAGAMGYLTVASLVIWGVTHTNPLEMIGQMLTAIRDYITNAAGVLKAAIRIGVPAREAIPLVAAGGLIVGTILMALLRDGPLLAQFAVASVIAKFWAYHHPYDDLMLIFLLIQLGQSMFVKPTSLNKFAFVAVGLSLVWQPPGYEGYRWPMAVAQHVAWFVGLFVVLRDGIKGRDILEQNMITRDI